MNIKFQKSGTTLTAKPAGRMDTATSPEISRRMQHEMQGMTEIIIDLENVEYISSGGLRLMLELEQTIQDNGGSLTIIHVSEYIMEVLDLTGFTDMLNIQ